MPFNVGRAAHVGQNHAAAGAPDPRYLDQLAQRLAADACLPLAVAQRRVMRLAVSAKERG